jgi:maleylacetoacetate isomerase/maleylpyruvate isomerase
LPLDPVARAQARAIAQSIACDIHPLNNLRVLNYLKGELGVGEEERKGWYRHWVTLGFAALEHMLAATAGSYCVGDNVTLADVCLVPQLFNARRFDVDLTPYPRLVAVGEALERLPAFAAAHPSRQPDAPPA